MLAGLAAGRLAGAAGLATGAAAAATGAAGAAALVACEDIEAAATEAAGAGAAGAATGAAETGAGAAAAEGTRIEGPPAGLGGRLMRTVCFFWADASAGFWGSAAAGGLTGGVVSGHRMFSQNVRNRVSGCQRDCPAICIRERV